MPGFIDAHRHIINGNGQQWFEDQARSACASSCEFLEAGYSSLMSGGGPVPGIVRAEVELLSVVSCRFSVETSHWERSY